MTRPLEAFWWSPARSPRALASELLHRPRAWLRVPAREAVRLTNYGDELTPLLLTAATGRRVRWAPAHRAEVVAVGSVLALALHAGKSLVWGTGLHGPVATTDDERASLHGRALAVRGPHTRDELGLDAALPLGDPGLLVRLLAPEGGPRDTAPVFVPHFSTLATDSGRRTCRAFARLGYTVADPSLRPRAMIALLARARHVVSAGMHGLILSHALGTPVVLTETHRRVRSARWKYHDYHASVGLGYHAVPFEHLLTDATAGPLVDEAVVRGRHVSTRLDGMTEGLLAAATVLRTR